jgi:hypothetical protein
VGFTLTGARAAAPPALPVEALDPPRLVVEPGELADLRAGGHEEEAPHLSIAAVRGLDRRLDDQRQVSPSGLDRAETFAPTAG